MIRFDRKVPLVKSLDQQCRRMLQILSVSKKNMILVSTFRLAILILLYGAGSSSAKASCSVVSPGYTLGAPITFTLSPVTVTPTDTSSSLLASATLSPVALSAPLGATGVNSYLVRCTSSSDKFTITGSTVDIGTLEGAPAHNGSAYWLKPLGNDVDIGLYLNFPNWNLPYPSASGGDFTLYLNKLTNQGESGTYNISAAVLWGGATKTFGAYLYKGASSLTSGGTWEGGTIATLNVSGVGTLATIDIDSFTVTVGACTINTYDTNVDLKSADATRFTSPGTTSNTTDFTINMTCSSPGLSPTLTFSGTADDDVSNVFANDSGTATGIGVQLLYGDSTITPDTAVSLGTTTSTSATDYDFKARLYQTARAVTAGSVDTTVTFTLDYE